MPRAGRASNGRLRRHPELAAGSHRVVGDTSPAHACTSVRAGLDDRQSHATLRDGPLGPNGRTVRQPGGGLAVQEGDAELLLRVQGDEVGRGQDADRAPVVIEGDQPMHAPIAHQPGGLSQ